MPEFDHRSTGRGIGLKPSVALKIHAFIVAQSIPLKDEKLVFFGWKPLAIFQSNAATTCHLKFQEKALNCIKCRPIDEQWRIYRPVLTLILLCAAYKSRSSVIFVW